jgi:hypothetical protein
MVTDVSQSHDQRPLQQSVIEVNQGTEVVRGRTATWQYMQPWGPRSIEVRSRAFLFQRGKWFVKYRVTNAVEADERVRQLVEELMTTLVMPPGT